MQKYFFKFNKYNKEKIKPSEIDKLNEEMKMNA